MKPKGIVDNVLVQIDKFYYPVDFLVINRKLRVDFDSMVPLILGRPSLTTTNANINYKNLFDDIVLWKQDLGGQPFSCRKASKSEER